MNHILKRYSTGRCLLIWVILVFSCVSQNGSAQAPVSNRSFECDSNILDQRTPFRFKNQRERSVGLWVMYNIELGQLNQLIDSANEIGRIIAVELTNNKKPNLNRILTQISRLSTSLKTHGDISELRSFEKSLYCYLKSQTQFMATIQNIIKNNSCSAALEKIKNYYNQMLPEDKIAFSHVTIMANQVKDKFKLDSWQPTKKEADDFVNSH